VPIERADPDLRRTRRLEWIAALAVALITFIVFIPSLSHGFVDWDDTDNFIENQHFRGFTDENLAWMWTVDVDKFFMGHYIPLTWMSIALDYEIWGKGDVSGLNPGAYHTTNNLIHSINAGLFFLLAARLLRRTGLKALSGSATPIVIGAALGALFFSLHPLRVESVAWATERRDLLSSFFVLLTLLAYLRAIESSGRAYLWRMLLCLTLFLAALLSKVSVVVVPVLMLVLDWYPLRRISLAPLKLLEPANLHRVLEKAPFFALSLVFGLIASAGQSKSRTLYTLDSHPLDGRIAQSFYALVFYLRKTFAPHDLLPLYELHLKLDPFEPRFVVSAVIVLILGTVLAVFARRVPFLAAAGMWYAVTLLPVIGLAQNGPQLVADRYTYVATMSVAVLLGGGIAWAMVAARNRPALAYAVPAAMVVLLATLSYHCWRQNEVWRSTETLWTYTSTKDPGSSLAQNGLGYVRYTRAEELARRGDAAGAAALYEQALAAYLRAIEIKPDNEQAHNNIWIALSKLGRYEELLAATDSAIALFKKHGTLLEQSQPTAYTVRAWTLNQLRRHDEAIASAQEALRLNPNHAAAYFHIGNAYTFKGELDKAIAAYQETVARDRSNALAWFNMGMAFNRTGRPREASGCFAKAVELQPDNPDFRRMLAPATASPG